MIHCANDEGLRFFDRLPSSAQGLFKASYFVFWKVL